MDQVRVEATEADVVRMPYHLYVLPEEKSKYSFNNLTLSLVQTATAMGTNIGIQGPEGINYRELWGKVVDFTQVAAENRHVNRSDLQKALRADKAFVILTSRTMAGKRPIATQKETKTLSDFARAITTAIQSGK
jgi:ornithine carbamoyltransferase